MMSLDVEKDRILQVEIERLLPGGVGLAHAEGLTLFVSLAAPGDVLRVEIDRVQGKIGFASIVEVVKPSPVRLEPPCPYFGRCGGCDFQQLTYDAQLEAKLEIIRDCLHRIAKIEAPQKITIAPSPNQWRYRARANWQVDSTAKLLGYFERGSNRICDVGYCAVLVPELQETLEQVRNRIFTESSRTQLRDIDSAIGDEGVSVAPPLAGFKTQVVSRHIGNETYYFSAEAFFQVNHDLLAALIAEALAEARGQTAVDLYCGVGLFTVPLARRFERVTGVEAHAGATHFARRNIEFAKRDASVNVTDGTGIKAKPSDLGQVQIVTARVGDWLEEHSSAARRVDFLLLDPPRTGCENRDIAGILALRPAQISYVSCDPATLARDLKKLIAAGYSLDSIAAFDMFPQTHHVETVARLSVVTAESRNR
ncbi:MAG TPA: class I SAM-dependent RNA methyltransferase [Pyrinomonadaceae bacterium]|jgi:23S rRNA (uracil1939-C5)-methyltransferase